MAALGVVGGFILQGYLSNTNTHPTVINQTNTSFKNTTHNQTNNTTSSNSGFIGSQKAIKIAKPIIGTAPGIVYNAELVTKAPQPYYL